MSALWTSKEVLEATGGDAKPKKKWEATGISIDSRTTKKGDLFVAIKGDNKNGHEFVEKALKKGAVAAIISEEPEKLPKGANLVIVKNTIEALAQLAIAARTRSEAKIFAVTGSVGKTSVKEALNVVLSTLGKTYATEGNLNNHIGLPLSLARMPADTEYGVFELGMNHAGEISYLTNILRPDVAIITAIEAVHLEFFESIEQIADAKSEILEGVVDGGIAVLPFDSKFYGKMEKAARAQGIENVISFGSDDGARYRLIGRGEETEGQSLRVNIDGIPVVYKLGSAGKHAAINSVAVLAAIANACNLEPKKFMGAFKEVKPAEGRGKIYKLKLGSTDFTLIDDSYNASPASMRAAIDTLSQVKIKIAGRSIAALGDMLELGENSVEFHKSLKDDISKSKTDVVYTVGEMMSELYNELPEEIRGGHFASTEELFAAIEKEMNNNDILLIKGSHGTEMWKLAESIRKKAKSRK